MKVTLLGYTSPESLEATEDDVIFTALSQCYNKSFDIKDSIATPDVKKNKIITSVLKSGHTSVTEHINFTFLIENVSRALTHQLVRHRLASYSQRSGRYTGLDDGENWYVVPPSINNPYRVMIYSKWMEFSRQQYNLLVNDGVPKEDARYGLPNGQFTNIVATMNCRTLQNFFAHRLCTRAQWEIRSMANEMAKICKEVLPVIFEDNKFGYPACVQNGFCTEEKCCGKMKKLSDILKDENHE